MALVLRASLCLRKKVTQFLKHKRDFGSNKERKQRVASQAIQMRDSNKVKRREKCI